MNIGAFMETEGKIYVYAFHNIEEEIPYSSLKNAIVSKENDGYFTVTEIKNRKVNPLEFFIIRNSIRLENPFEISTIRMANLFGRTAREFEVIESETFGRTCFKEFTSKLIGMGFYRADKVNFKRAISRDKFDRRRKEAN